MCTQMIRSEPIATAVVVTATLVMTVTGYTACDPGMRCDGVTASGMLAREGICACGHAFDFGTAFFLPALHKVFYCQDRGGKIGNLNLDIFFTDKQEALQFGVQRHLVEARWWETVNNRTARRKHWEVKRYAERIR